MDTSFFAPMQLRSRKGFTLTELLIYLGIFAIVAGTLTGILTTVTRTQVQESSQTAVTGELNFSMQTIQRLVQESSLIDIPTGTATSTLVLKMKDAQDPSGDLSKIYYTKIYASNGRIYVEEQPNTAQPITSDKVVANTLEFKKFTQYPGKDVVQIDLALSDAIQVAGQTITRSLRSAISRASAATFDSDLLPGTDNTYSIGTWPTPRWKDASFSGLMTIGNTSSGGTLKLIGKTGTSLDYTIDTATGGYLRFKSASATATPFVITSSGNIGIGTSSPIYALDVSGIISAAQQPGSTSSAMIIVNQKNVAGSYGAWGIASRNASNLGFYNWGRGGDALTITASSSGFVFNFNGSRLTNLVSPTASSDAATKEYVDAAAGGGASKSQYFSSGGTFTVPSQVTLVWVTAWGGGGGGGGGCQATAGASGGGGGEIVYRYPVTVTGGQNITVTIGSGGSGGAYQTATCLISSGTNGSDTTFGSYVTAKGGIAGYGSGGAGGGVGGGDGGTEGVNGSRGIYSAYTMGGAGGGGGSDSSGNASDGGPSPMYAGGITTHNVRRGGGGGGGFKGVGGNESTSAAANTGAGGGGGSSGASGGNGGSGGVIVEWVE